jgi:rhomboid protease GluP
MEGSPEYVIRETMLSQKPRAHSRAVAALTFGTVLSVTLLAWRDGGALLPALVATSNGVLDGGEYWRLLTAVAVHSDLTHFLANSIFLAFFPYLLFGYFGFWVFPVLALVSAGLANYFSLLTYPPRSGLLGASGLIYWMAGFWLCIYLLVDRSLSLGKRAMRAIVVILVVLLPERFQENVGYRIHAIGFGLGVSSAYAYFRFRRDAIRAMEVVELQEP